MTCCHQSRRQNTAIGFWNFLIEGLQGICRAVRLEEKHTINANRAHKVFQVCLDHENICGFNVLEKEDAVFFIGVGCLSRVGGEGEIVIGPSIVGNGFEMRICPIPSTSAALPFT